MELKMTPWTEDTPPTEEELHEFLTGQELNVFRWVSPPHGVFDGHTHGYHKILYVVTGSVKFEFPTRTKPSPCGRATGWICPPGCATAPWWATSAPSAWKRTSTKPISGLRPIPPDVSRLCPASLRPTI
jgi:hypothetical protein